MKIERLKAETEGGQLANHSSTPAPLKTTQSSALSTQHLIIGTAGHIDHGKTTLVRALTGVDADRLPEEKRRGITIDIGFAELDLDGVRIGFVDVPGHERFVKNMLAGAHGIDAVVLVIAADEGVMPQTREHFEVCRLLGVKTGLIALTKVDAVDDELLPLVRAEAEELVEGSFLAGAPVVAVSARTGAGLDELRTRLGALAGQTPPRADEYVARLPIDRAFTMRGFGAVVTGTLVAGSVSEGEEMEVLPAGARVRVRGVQTHGRSVGRAEAGQRTALNLGGIEADRLERGMVLAPPARLRPTQMIDARLEVLPTAPRALRSRARVRVHLGAAEVLARVQVLEEAGELLPGASGFAQLRLEAPIVAISGERFIIRSYSPARTVAGGVVLDGLAARHRGRERTAVRARLAALAGADPAQQVTLLVGAAGERGTTKADLAAHTGWRDKSLEDVLAGATQAGTVVEAEGVYLDPTSLANLIERAVGAVREYHRAEPLARGLARETLRERIFANVPAEVFRAALARAEIAGKLVAEREIVRAREHQLTLGETDARWHEALERLYREAGLEVPGIEEALARVTAKQTGARAGEQARKLLQLLINAGTLVRIGDLVFHRETLAELIRKLRDHAARSGSDRTIDVATFKDLTGVTRKYAIPLLEYLDRERITRRAGDRRLIL